MSTTESQPFRLKMAGNLKDVGVFAFNEDHRKFLDYLLNFHELVERLSKGRPTKKDWQDIVGMLHLLANYAQKHFMSEETWMREHNYPELAVHRQEHDDFLKTFAKHQSALIEDREIFRVVDLKFFMLDWFYNHINRVDVRYKPFFEGLSLSQASSTLKGQKT